MEIYLNFIMWWNNHFTASTGIIKQQQNAVKCTRDVIKRMDKIGKYNPTVFDFDVPGIRKAHMLNKKRM